MTHAQMVALYNALLRKLHGLRQEITSLYTGDPICNMPPVGISGELHERMKDPAVAMFEISKLAKEIRELNATIAQILKDRSMITYYASLPSEELHNRMRNIAKEFELPIKGE